MTQCPCGSELTYNDCCQPAHTGLAPSTTAEALMRSRYCAYVKKCIPYLGESLHPEHRDDWSEEETQRWAENSDWLSLEVISTEAGQADDNEGIVEFIATFKENNTTNKHHEISHFSKVEDKWYYVDGSTPKPVTIRHDKPKVGRNAPCPCGSGKKYKKCCG